MAHFAKLDSDNTVIHVSVVDNDILIDEFGNESEELGIRHLTKVHGYSNWKQTSYTGKIRGHYASIGYKYDQNLDLFIPPNPFSSWSFNKSNARWEAPIPRPNDGNLYYWSEDDQKFILDVFEAPIIEEEFEGPTPEELVSE